MITPSYTTVYIQLTVRHTWLFIDEGRQRREEWRRGTGVVTLFSIPVKAEQRLDKEELTGTGVVGPKRRDQGPRP